MNVIVAFIGWKWFWKAQAPVARASQVLVNRCAINAVNGLWVVYYTYGGWANGMPRNRATRPMQTPAKVALSSCTSGGAPPISQNPLYTVGIVCSCITKGLIDAARAKTACSTNKTRIGRTMRICVNQSPWRVMES